jgi:hypothetical protein
MWKPWKPWELGSRSNERAVANARAAATELSRLRVERAEIELYVARLAAERPMVADQPA